jgi:septin family protein
MKDAQEFIEMMKAIAAMQNILPKSIAPNTSPSVTIDDLQRLLLKVFQVISKDSIDLLEDRKPDDSEDAQPKA